MGVLRYSPSDFWACTLGELLTAVEYFQNIDNGRQQAAWERSRFVAHILLQPHAKKGTRIKAEDICQFTWEKERDLQNSEVRFSKERIKELAKYSEENSYLSF
tara:strand:- start:101 stop:409 length:309 start_codon:yes stop_codon:yes gene_type:complete